MVWVFVFGAIALAGLGMLVGYAVWLAHKMSDLFSELRVLGDRGGELMGLAAQIGVPQRASGTAGYDEDLTVSGDVSA